MKKAGAIALAGLAAMAAGAAGIGAGYALWGRSKDWYGQPDLSALAADPDGELIRYGRQLLIDTARHIGRSAEDPDKRYAGNDLACSNCHLNAGLQPFAAPLVSTFASYPMMVNDRVVTLTERINGCMTRSMNGSPLPETGREMQALIAYIQFVGRGTPVGVRVPGMGLRALKEAEVKPDPVRGQAVYAQLCATCHGPEGQGHFRTLKPVDGYDVPPLWGPDSFNAAAGMSDIRTAAAFVHANMPAPVDYRSTLLTTQQAWDVAAFITSQPRPAAPKGSE